MADNVVTLKKQNDEDAEKKLEGFMARNRNVIIICAVAVVAVALLVCLCVGIKSGSSKKGLAAMTSSFSAASSSALGSRIGIGVPRSNAADVTFTLITLSSGSQRRIVCPFSLYEMLASAILNS